MAYPVNQLVPTELLLNPEDVKKLRIEYPTLLMALEAQQTVINQIITRVGGSGNGDSLDPLDDLTARVDDNERLNASPDVQIAALRQDLAMLRTELAVMNAKQSKIDDFERMVAINAYG